MARPRRRRLEACLVGAAIAAAGFLTAPAAAQTPQPQPLVTITIPVFDGDRPVGTISARVNQGGDYRIPVASLIPILQPLYATNEFSVISSRLQNMTEIGPEEVSQLRLPIRFDPQRVALILQIPADVRGRTVLELGASGRAPEPTASRRSPEGFSGYLNMNFGLVDDPTLVSGQTRGALLLEGSLRAGGFVLESSGTVEVGGVHGQTFSRQATRLTRDFPSAGIRVSAGDIFTSSVGFVGSTDILGFSAFKNVDVFDPFQTSRPIGRQSFVLGEPSDVDIFVNGALVRQAHLQAGNYDLTNFPQTEGANDVRVEVRNGFGQTQTFSFSSFFNANLLAPGVSQWEFSAGVAATRFDRQIRYDFGDLVAAGFFRRGITSTLTAGVNGRYFDHRAIVGTELVAATRIANISFDLAASRGSHRYGAAVALTFQPQLPESWKARGRAIDGFVEYSTRNFGDNAVTGFGRGFRIGLRYSEVLNDRLSFSASVGLDRVYGPGRDGIEASASFAYRFENDFIFRVTPEYLETSQGSAGSIRFSLTKRFGRTSRANTSYDTRENRYIAEYDYRSQYGGVGTLGANITVTGADNQERIADAFVDYIGNRFEGSVGYAHIVDGDRFSQLGRVRANLATSIAFAGGEVAIGRPVRDSFAIVSAHPTLGDRQVIVGPGSADQGDRARSGALGPALLPDLGSYSLARVPFNVENLPVGYDLGTGAFEFFPPYRSGYAVEVGSNRLAAAVGFILSSDHEPLALAVGTASSPTDRDFQAQQVFTNRNGRFGISGLVPGNTYIVTFAAVHRTVRIEVPANATGFVNVGSIVATGE